MLKLLHSRAFLKSSISDVRLFLSTLNPNKNADLDYSYFSDPENALEIQNNIIHRNSDANIDKVLELSSKIKENNSSKELMKKQLYQECIKIPNKSSPHLQTYGREPNLLRYINEKPEFNFKPKEFDKIVENLLLLTMSHHLSLMCGPKSYIFKSELAEIENALIRYTLQKLLKIGFKLLSVPDLILSDVIQRCGMQTTGPRSQVYHLKCFEELICLSGTSEMAIGGFLKDTLFDYKNLPLKFVAVSRCYRQEVGSLSSEKGIFRVHEFNKVEMFTLTEGDLKSSERMYKELVDIQIEMFDELGLHCKVLDMPMCDLGAPAYTKIDIEALMGSNFYGEISSASNCLDFQSRRLNIKYKNSDGKLRYCHTLNGTACATPRVLMALVRSNQTKDGSVRIPEVLRPFMGEKDVISKQKPKYNMTHFHALSYPGNIVDFHSECVNEYEK